MRTGLLLITHGDIGASLLRETEIMVGPLPLPYALISVTPDAEIAELRARAQQAITALRQATDQVLVLTDLYGASPSNVAHQLDEVDAIVHGVNLGMLLKIANYASLSLSALVEKALEGGRQAIFGGADPSD